MHNAQWILTSRPNGLPAREHWEWKEDPLPAVADGQIRVRVIYLSLDPANRGWMSRDSYVPAVPLGSVMRGVGIGVVEESRNSRWTVGDRVVGILGWQQHYIGDGKGIGPLPAVHIPLEAHFGILGHIGLTAYFGLLDIGQPKAGETLVVSAAAGAVGSIAGQIGKIKDCRVVGLAGSDEKCEWIRSELGFDAAINYRNENLREALAAHCPDGIDIYFENVGGKTLDAVLERMNNFGRIPVCGMIAGYNNARPEPGPSNLIEIVVKRLKLQGFLVSDYYPRAEAAIQELVEWHLAGRLKYRLDITHGLENAPQAFLSLFDGSNRGKVVVQVSDAV